MSKRWWIAVAIVGVGLGCDRARQGTGASEQVVADAKTEQGGQAESSPRARTAPPRPAAAQWEGNLGALTIPAPAREDAQAAPVALSTSRLEIEVLIVGRMARTQVRQIFDNHTDRRTEGSYTFELPEGAAISRLAMEVGGELMEGELVERERARQIYEGIVRKREDPALLEWQGRRRFKTQIFPIEPNSDKEVVLAYEQLLPTGVGGAEYVYALPELQGDAAARIGEFTFVLRAEDATGLEVEGYEAKVEQRSSGGQVQYTAREFVPAGPMRVGLTPAVTSGVARYRAERDGERFFLADLRPELERAKGEDIEQVVFAVDTSAGLGQPVLEDVGELVRAMIGRRREGARYQIVTGALEARLCAEVPLKAEQARACLEGLEARGATDLGALLEATGQAVEQFEQGSVAVVVLTDGVASMGELDGDLVLERAAEALGAERVTAHTVAVGHAPDEAWLRRLARRLGGQSARMTPADDPVPTAEALGELVRQPLLRGVRVEVTKGQVERLVPGEPVHLARGESLAILGQLSSASAELTVTASWQGRPWKEIIALGEGAGPVPSSELVVDFWARGYIDELERAAAPRQEVTKLSKRYGVMSRYTSFLVLESEEMYERFEIERRQAAEREEARRRGSRGAEEPRKRRRPRRARPRTCASARAT